MDTDQHIYRSYLLRLWRSKDDPTASWYASLEDPVNRTRKGFSNLDTMVEFLKSNLENDAGSLSKRLKIISRFRS